ncbi:MAG: hypothetical protein A2252_09395 [Elusimicrobia bacterium RIFOXYA2_FULL_39_19]|nr:MAG: hypothetical protein A2252_09395 [Elusimicrobia bacterium RIFOXYA2_FULL_39_19]
MIKSGRRIKLELIRFTVYVVLAVMMAISVNFYWFLSTVLPPTMLAQSLMRIVMFSVIELILILGITVLLVKWFTFTVIGPLPRLQEEINDMVSKDEFRDLVVRNSDKIKEFVDSVNLIIQRLNKK